MKYLMAGLWLALPLSALAAEPVAQAAAAPAVGSVGGQLTQLLLGLLLVIGLIFVLAWLMRRVQRIGPGNAQVIELVGSRALGPRDRLVLVQVGEEQILLGITPGRITPLHVLKTPVDAAKTEAATPEFAQRLMELLGKDQKDKK
ncbi:Flagellar biosynthesis protein FliO [Pseudomonas orientalis]|uniref:flagellar biosynthetic protein FliO n=1 Tax=Pseudomonas orientalis TaxID=76758 RepID=UPI000F55FB55|nr:flagellar biosynthetic protein FliO [Pseudomonas orientalis]AZF01162.1 Flagellar biosynthesis protein FliO [Pseudomonas orientalis]